MTEKNREDLRVLAALEKISNAYMKNLLLVYLFAWSIILGVSLLVYLVSKVI